MLATQPRRSRWNPVLPVDVEQPHLKPLRITKRKSGGTKWTSSTVLHCYFVVHLLQSRCFYKFLLVQFCIPFSLYPYALSGCCWHCQSISSACLLQCCQIGPFQFWICRQFFIFILWHPLVLKWLLGWKTITIWQLVLGDVEKKIISQKSIFFRHFLRNIDKNVITFN